MFFLNTFRINCYSLRGLVDVVIHLLQILVNQVRGPGCLPPVLFWAYVHLLALFL